MEGQKKIQVNCSPGTFGKISNDPELVENYTQHLMETQGHFDEIVFAPIAENVEPVFGESPACDDEDIFTPLVGCQETCPDKMIVFPLDNSQEECPDEGIAGTSVWSDSATKLLLEEVKNLWGKVGKSVNLKSKSQLWKVIAEKLSKKGYGFSQNQVESKFRGLERQYKKTKLNNSKTGRSRMTCVYQSQLDEVFGVKKGINPDYTLESDFQPPVKPSPQVKSSQEALYEGPSTSHHAAEVAERDDGPSTSRNAAKLTERGKLLKKLDSISKRKEDRHNKLIELLERRDEERKERDKRREEMGREIIDLLKSIRKNN